MECVLAEDWEEMKLNEPGSQEAETECMALGEAYHAHLLLTSESFVLSAEGTSITASVLLSDIILSSIKKTPKEE